MSIKKSIALLIAALICFALCGAVAEGDTGVGMPNPMEEYESFEEMRAAIPGGIRMALPPDDAQEITYFTISKQIAQIDFYWDGDFYTYRAVHAKDDDEFEDMHGVYVDFDEDLEDSDAEEEKLTIPEYADDFDIEYNLNDGQVLVSWYCEKCSQRFSLYSETAGYPQMNLLFLLIDYPEFVVCHAE